MKVISDSNLRLNLNKVQNQNCIKNCTKKNRKEITENDLCIGTKSVIDELPVRCVGSWAIKKIYLLYQYFGIFTVGMKDKWAGKLNYIEICSGPGRCISRNDGSEFDGTAMGIMNHPAFKHLKYAMFVDNNESVVNTLNERIKAIGHKNAFAVKGDYTVPSNIVGKLNQYIGDNTLNLVFIDPTDCSVPFGLLEELKQVGKNIDFIINLASGTDLNRNVVNAIKSPDQYTKSVSKYSKFLGSSDYFFDPINLSLANNGGNRELRINFREAYIRSLKKIGYEHFDFKQVEHFYDILFATSHQKGLEFWKKATNIHFDGQRTFDFK